MKSATSGASETTESPTLAAAVLERLRDDILKCRLLPGDRLRFSELRATYGVGLSPLREALSRLTAENLVVARGQRGFSVADVSPEDFRDLVRLRLQIEGLALSDAIQRGGDEWETEVVSANHRLQLAGDPLSPHGRAREVDSDQWARRHKAFHMALLGGCGSPRLFGLCRSLFDQAERYRRLIMVRGSLPRDTQEEHAALMQAALARDAGGAVELLRQHISLTADTVAGMAGDGTENRGMEDPVAAPSPTAAGTAAAGSRD